VLRVVSRLRTQGRIGAPNGARRGAQSPAARAASRLIAGRAARLVLSVAAATAATTSVASGQSQRAIVRSEVIFGNVPFASAHASTIAESAGGLVAAWFGGSFEGAEDVGIWLARFAGSRWSQPIEVATGAQGDGKRFPCWNPVLFQKPNGALLLFYKVGASPREWWGMVMSSTDGGRTWSKPVRLPDGTLGPIKNKPVQLRDGTIVSPSSTESRDTPPRWRVHFERSTDGGRTWTRVVPAPRSGGEINAIQPTILARGDSLEALVRTQASRVYATWSADGGKTWSPLAETGLVNPNAGIDGVTLRDGRALLVYNNSPRARTPLTVAVSPNGKDWTPAIVLESEPGEYSYPAVIQSRDGMVHITYTWKRLRIKHVVVDPRLLR
jgi:predicted neuraminidase